MKRSFCISLTLAFLLGCGEEEGPSFLDLEGIFPFNDSLDVVKLGFKSASSEVEGSELYFRFYLIKKTKREKPVPAGLDMPYWDWYRYYKNDSSFYISNSRNALRLIGFNRDKKITPEVHPDLVLSENLSDIRYFGVANGKKYWLYDTSIFILGESEKKRYSYSEFVDQGLRYLTNASIYDDNILFTQRSGDTLCAFNMNKDGLKKFCDAAPFDSYIQSWAMRDTLIYDRQGERPILRSKFRMDFEAGRFSHVSTDSLAIPAVRSKLHFPIAYGDSVIYYGNEFH